MKKFSEKSSKIAIISAHGRNIWSKRKVIRNIGLRIVYWFSYKPTQNTLRKHGISKKLKTRKDIAIVRPGKGSAVVILDRDI